jgi:hypothetical protein
VDGDKVVVFDDLTAPLRTWIAQDHIDFGDATGDVCHSNSVTMPEGADHFLFNCRNTNTTYKVDVNTGEVMWAHGYVGDFVAVPDVIEHWPIQPHDPEVQPNGNVLIYDNGGVLRPHGRVVEYTLDDVAMTSTIVWEWPGENDVDSWYLDDWYSPIWGDADRQANGNTLVTAGTRIAGAESRIFEVTDDGEVVWELILPAVDDTTGVYRAQRVVLEGWTGT